MWEVDHMTLDVRSCCENQDPKSHKVGSKTITTSQELRASRNEAGLLEIGTYRFRDARVSWDGSSRSSDSYKSGRSNKDHPSACTRAFISNVTSDGDNFANSGKLD